MARTRIGGEAISLSRIGRITCLALVSLPLLAACTLGRDATDEHDMTALMRAARGGDAAEVGRLVVSGARVEQAVRGHGELRELVAFLSWMRQLPARDPGFRALHYAAAGGHRNVVRLLLDVGADPGAIARDGATPLSLAAWTGDPELVRVLLDAGAPSRRPEGLADRVPWNSPLGGATVRADESVVRMLLDAGAIPDPGIHDGTTPLAAAASRGDAGMVALLLERGAAPERSGSRADTPLMLSATPTGSGHSSRPERTLTCGHRSGIRSSPWP